MRVRARYGCGASVGTGAGVETSTGVTTDAGARRRGNRRVYAQFIDKRLSGGETDSHTAKTTLSFPASLPIIRNQCPAPAITRRASAVTTPSDKP